MGIFDNIKIKEEKPPIKHVNITNMMSKTPEEPEDEMETEEIIVEKHQFDDQRTLTVTKYVDRGQIIAEYRAVNGDSWIQFIRMNEDTYIVQDPLLMELIPGNIVRYNILENCYDIELMIIIKKDIVGMVEFFQITVP
jgi:hypothetical protein